jgi:hypothetical protein
MSEYRRAKRQPTGDYKVGYARTPEHTRFPHQRNAYRGGRRQKSVEDFLREALFRRVAVAGDPRRRRMPRIQVLLENLAQFGCQREASAARRDLMRFMKAFPETVRPRLSIRVIDDRMTPEEAQKAYAETIRAIPGVIDPPHELDL